MPQTAVCPNNSRHHMQELQLHEYSSAPGMLPSDHPEDRLSAKACIA